MSVQTEITRLNTAKSNIATAITNKGVTVPDGTKLDGMAALIDGIEAASELAEEVVAQDEIIEQITTSLKNTAEEVNAVGEEITAQDEIITQLTDALKSTAETVAGVNEEVTAQDDLIAQIMRALQSIGG